MLCHKNLKKLIDLANRVEVKITSLSHHGSRPPIIDGLDVTVDTAASSHFTSVMTETTIPMGCRMLAKQYAAAHGINGSPQPIVLATRRSNTAGQDPIYGHRGGGSESDRNGRPHSMGRRVSGGYNRLTRRASIDRPVWACCAHGWPNATMDHWYDTMVEYGCDDGSCKRFMLFAHLSPAAYGLANRLLDKLIMWRGDSGRINSPSAFIEAGVESARRELHPGGAAVHGGKRKRDHREG